MNKSNKRTMQVVSLTLLVILLVVTYLVYKPGLSGGFTYDDYHSLKKLAVFEGEVTTKKLIQYLGQSDTGVLKRPISIYSFLLDAQTWPAPAYSFKRTNLIIHLSNGVLLFLLINLLFSYKKDYRKVGYVIAFGSSAIWLLHPFLVSTTLYVVQRMAMLTVTFLLLGMLSYLYFRIKSNRDQSRFNTVLLFLAVWGGTFLAILSKENGVLVLPLMALFEVFIIQKYLGIPALSKPVSRILLTLPIIVLVLGVVLMIPKFIAGYEIRDFTVFERLLTQGRVLVDYFYHLLIPKYFTYGVYTDGFVASSGLFKPVSTILSLLLIVGLLLVAWFLRHRRVWVSFSVFFFFIAHSLESSFIPLEMYFEHRNYMAALFLPVPVCLLITRLFPKPHVHWTVLVLILTYLCTITSLRTHLWSNEFKLHEMTMEKFPESTRIYTATAQYYAASGYTVHAISILNKGIARHEDLHLKLNKIYLYCEQPSMTKKQYSNLFEGLIQSFETQPFMKGDRASFTALFRDLLQNQCHTGQDAHYAERMYDALANNPYNDRHYLKMLIEAYGMFYHIERNQFESAAENVHVLIHQFGQYVEALNGIRLLLKNSEHQIARSLLDELQDDYKRRYHWKPDLNYYGEQISTLYDWVGELEAEKYNRGDKVKQKLDEVN